MAAYDVPESRRRVVAARDQGMTADDARYAGDVIVSRRTVFRWWARYDLDGDAALAEGRHAPTARAAWPEGGAPTAAARLAEPRLIPIVTTGALKRPETLVAWYTRGCQFRYGMTVPLV